MRVAKVQVKTENLRTMERRKSELLSAVLSRYLREQGLEGPLLEHRLLAAWPVVAGKLVETYTESTAIRNQTLLVKLRSAPLRANLQMRRTELVDKLNKAVGATVIYDIRFM